LAGRARHLDPYSVKDVVGERLGGPGKAAGRGHARRAQRRDPHGERYPDASPVVRSPRAGPCLLNGGEHGDRRRFPGEFVGQRRAGGRRQQGRESPVGFGDVVRGELVRGEQLGGDPVKGVVHGA
jgi:hypothetical protein